MLKEISSFDKMITPVIIKIIFWLGIAGSVIAGLSAIISGAGSSYGGGAQVLTGLLILIFGPISTRIYCELLIILFKMYELLNEIKINMTGAVNNSPVQVQSDEEG